eukprot:TRINITY_DN3774_c0_g1_i1.p2 TRINITY_DN3774_c0_g1~~TRINITY_DN3774_c0_g1_i1.p2  ORF type:complete len:183 (+),score=23.29 TRINITY_DN3774_c0_g1_i1:183-731(+)
MVKLFVLIVLPLLGATIEHPCSACLAIANVLQQRLDEERPRNHLDFRHRLDSEGKRYGKMVEYRMSELRVYELLEDLCHQLSNFTLGLVNVSTQSEQEEWQWVKIKGEGKLDISKDKLVNRREQKERGRQLEAYCGRILTDHEESISQALQKDEVEEVGQFLCADLMGSCKKLVSKQKRDEL